MNDGVLKRILGGVLIALGASGCLASSFNAGSGSAIAQVPVSSDPIAQIADLRGRRSMVFVAYGDMRFTDPAETDASHSWERQALVSRIADERPSALFLNGDIPWHGGNVDDYRVFAEETSVWRDAHIAVFPALGNHEFSQCEESQCLENWWNAFPALRGRRWYSVAIGSAVYALNLDSDAPLLAGSQQREWLEQQLAGLPKTVRFVLISLHHPPVADLQSGHLAGHNPRPNEKSLADYLAKVAQHSAARFIVSAGHIHNYERNEQDGVTYLVSGGGGARPYPVTRAETDRYQDNGFPNFHYLRFELGKDRLSVKMIRLANPDAKQGAAAWEVMDAFDLVARKR